MCGLFGAIGGRINPGIIRALAIANRERGSESLGFFNSTGKMCKQAGDPLDCLAENHFADFIDNSAKKCWFVVGHTRQSSRGKVSNKNAHPFRYGRIIGAHNGIVSAPKRYTVDSQYIFDRLNSCGGDYQAALGNLGGYWGLAWFDGRELFLQAHRNTIAMGRDRSGTMYFSSDINHLAACLRLERDENILGEGETVKFDCKSRKPIQLPPVKVSASEVIKFDPVTIGKGHRDFDDGTLCNYDDKYRDAMRDPFYCRDDEWLANWDRYVKDYE